MYRLKADLQYHTMCAVQRVKHAYVYVGIDLGSILTSAVTIIKYCAECIIYAETPFHNQYC